MNHLTFQREFPVFPVKNRKLHFREVAAVKAWKGQGIHFQTVKEYQGFVLYSQAANDQGYICTYHLQDVKFNNF